MCRPARFHACLAGGGTIKIKAGHECTGGDETALQSTGGGSFENCRDKCIAKKGSDCKFFIFGTGSNKGSCWWEETCNTFAAGQFDVYSVYSVQRK